MVRIYVNVGMTSEHNDMQALGLPDLVATSWLKNMSLESFRGLWKFDVVHLSLLYFYLFINFSCYPCPSLSFSQSKHTLCTVVIVKSIHRT